MHLDPIWTIWTHNAIWWEWILNHIPFLTIPIVSGLVGYITNVLALKMTFYPIRYVGIGPIGWQGIIPSKAPKMADLSVDLMTARLVNVEEIFSSLDSKRLTEEMEESMTQIARQLIDEIVDAQAPHPQLWYKLPQQTRDKIYNDTAERLPEIMEEMMADMKTDIKELLNLKALAIDKLTEDKALINQIFLGVGKQEFRFIEQSGFYFGFLFGLVQMLIFYFYNPWWILPVAGLLVGYLTNYLAIFLIFHPIKPVRFMWVEFQGMFVKRQKAVANEYAKIIAERILTVDALFDYLLRGPRPQRIRGIVRKQVSNAVDATMGKYRWLIERIVGEHKMDVIKNIIHYRFMEELPVAIRDVFPYAQKALDIENLLATKMAALSEDDFVDFLRPVFQEDELKLIIIGAFLGGLAGLVQYFFLFAA